MAKKEKYLLYTDSYKASSVGRRLNAPPLGTSHVIVCSDYLTIPNYIYHNVCYYNLLS